MLIHLVAGEPSGDILGARLMAALRRRHPEVAFAGVGGARMAEAGLASLFPMQDLSLMGLVEVLPRLPLLLRRLDQAAAAILAEPPAVLVTIDAPAFTLRLAARVRPRGIRVAHYVAPQVWAWRAGRVRGLVGKVDRILALLPFEPPFFAAAGIPAEFVGHPVLEAPGVGDAARFHARHGLAPGALPIMVMPGSRAGEVTRLAAIFGAALALLPGNVVPVVPVAAAIAPAVRAAAASWPVEPILVEDAPTRADAEAAAVAGLIKSGTSSLEMARAGIPHVVGYRVHPVTAAIARRLIQVPHVSLVNLLAEREVVPERLQQDCTAAALAAALRPLLEPGGGAAQKAGFAAALAALQPPGGGLPSDAAAGAVLAIARGGGQATA